ncbi:MAG TPA: hypothetical protein VK177_17185 [Flavobacteriales bacterium]|nr:hypothetical protein [Flavobacteriales bacterium]
MRILLAIFFTTFSFLSIAQPNWKDSIRIKEPVLDVYKPNDFVYFKTKKGWGIYEPMQKWVAVQPAFDFILAISDERFAVVKKGKLMLVDKLLKQVDKTIYKRVGTGIERADAFTIQNNESIYPWEKEKDRYAQLDNRTESTLALFKNYVLVNAFEKAPDPYPIRSSTGVDSIAQDGNYVMSYSLPVMHSGVYDLKTKQWVIEPRYAKIGIVGNNIVVKEISLVKNALVEKVHVYNASLEKTGTYAMDWQGIEKKGQKAILAEYTNHETEEFLWYENLTPYVKFDNGKTQGIFDPVKFNFPLDSGKYEFVYVPATYPYTAFTVKNKKVGSKSGEAEPPSHYANDYTKLRKVSHSNRYSENTFWIMECNDNDKENIDLTDTTVITDDSFSYLKLPVKNASVEVVNRFVIVHDYEPREPDSEVTVIDPEGNEVPAIMPGDPGICKSGVFDLNTRKWIVPRRFTKINKVPAGFSCMRFYNDSLSFSMYSNEGKELFKNITKSELLASNAFIAQFTGVAYGGANKHYIVENAHSGMPLVINEKQKSGVFDLLRMNWVIQPVYDLVDYSRDDYFYLLVTNKKIGISSPIGQKIAEPAYTNIFYSALSNGYLLGDSIFVDGETFIATPVELKTINPEYTCENTTCSSLEARILGEKLFVNERANEYVYEPESDGFYRRTFYTHNTALSGYEEKKYPYAARVLPWNDLYLVDDTLGNYQLRNAKDEVVFNTITGIYLQKELAFSNVYGEWFFDELGDLVKYTAADYEMGVSMNSPAGSCKRFFANGKELKAPDDFYLLAANKQGTGLGFSIKAVEGKFKRTYHYINLNTGEKSACEFEFCNYGGIDIIPIKGGFVIMENCYGTQRTNVLLVDEDLKTVKSSFKEINSAEAISSVYPIKRYILFKLVVGQNEIFLDRDFQFLQECPAGSFELQYPSWNKLVLKSAQKTIVMKLDGQVIKK